MLPELDLLLTDDLLSDEERTVRDSVRRFVSSRVLPVIQSHYRAGTFPLELVPEMASLGLFGATLRGHGCAGLGDVAYGLMMHELERGDSGLRSFVSVQNGLVMHPIHAFGTEEQKRRWLPALCAGEAVGCFGLTEPDFGSNPAGLRATARRQGSEYVLDGSKMWITNGSIAHVAVVFARCDGEIRGFLVERGSPGFSARDIEGKLSLRASITSELVFDGCRVPASNALPGAVGLKTAFACLNRARYSIAWGAVGAATACFEEALDYARQRAQFGKPIAGFQMVQEKLVEMWSEIEKAWLLVHRVGRLSEAGKAEPAAISAAKRNNVRMALEVARAARDVLGANGIVDAYGAMRHMCNLEAVSTYEGTHDIHTLVVGQRLTGIGAFSSER
jgi:glutaryl-CoA dehydrogenase